MEGDLNRAAEATAGTADFTGKMGGSDYLNQKSAVEDCAGTSNADLTGKMGDTDFAHSKSHTVDDSAGTSNAVTGIDVGVGAHHSDIDIDNTEDDTEDVGSDHADIDIDNTEDDTEDVGSDHADIDIDNNDDEHAEDDSTDADTEDDGPRFQDAYARDYAEECLAAYGDPDRFQRNYEAAVVRFGIDTNQFLQSLPPAEDWPPEPEPETPYPPEWANHRTILNNIRQSLSEIWQHSDALHQQLSADRYQIVVLCLQDVYALAICSLQRPDLLDMRLIAASAEIRNYALSLGFTDPMYPTYFFGRE